LTGEEEKSEMGRELKEVKKFLHDSIQRHSEELLSVECELEQMKEEKVSKNSFLSIRSTQFLNRIDFPVW